MAYIGRKPVFVVVKKYIFSLTFLVVSNATIYTVGLLVGRSAVFTFGPPDVQYVREVSLNILYSNCIQLFSVGDTRGHGSTRWFFVVEGHILRERRSGSRNQCY